MEKETQVKSMSTPGSPVGVGRVFAMMVPDRPIFSSTAGMSLMSTMMASRDIGLSRGQRGGRPLSPPAPFANARALCHSAGMALLLAPTGGNPAEWAKLLVEAMPRLDIRIFPEIGDPADIDVAAVGRVPPGTLAKLPNLRLIVSLFAGQETLLADTTVPRHLPIVRAGHPEGDVLMNDTALLHVLRHHRLIPDYALAQGRREWKRLAVLRAGERRVGVLGLGPIGLGVAKALRDHGFNMAAWARRPRDIE